MPDSFENRINEKMQELRLQPEAVVWQNVESALMKKKKRRSLLVWWCLLLLGTGVFPYLYLRRMQHLGPAPVQTLSRLGTEKRSAPGSLTAVTSPIQKSSSDHIQVNGNRIHMGVRQHEYASRPHNGVVAPVTAGKATQRRGEGTEQAIRVNKDYFVQHRPGKDKTREFNQGRVDSVVTVPIKDIQQPGEDRMKVQITTQTVRDAGRETVLPDTAGPGESPAGAPTFPRGRNLRKLRFALLLDAASVHFEPALFSRRANPQSFAAVISANPGSGYSMIGTYATQRKTTQAGLGFLIQQERGRHLYFLTGAEFHYFKFETFTQRYRDSFAVNASTLSFVGRVTTAQEQVIIHNFDFQVPILAGWHFPCKRVMLGMEAGVQNAFHVGKVTVNSSPPYSGSPAIRVNTYVPSLFAGVNVRTSMTNKGSFVFQPYVQLAGKSYLRNNNVSDVANFYGMRIAYFFK